MGRRTWIAKPRSRVSSSLLVCSSNVSHGMAAAKREKELGAIVKKIRRRAGQGDESWETASSAARGGGTRASGRAMSLM